MSRVGAGEGGGTRMARPASALSQSVFTSLPTGSRTTNVAAALRAAILRGDLPPGSPLPEVRVASDLGVSRAPVREALRMLQEEGLVSKENYRGAFVAQVRPELVGEISSIRMRIEPYAVERSLAALAEDDFAELERAWGRLRVAVVDEADAAVTVDAHMAFHRMFYELAGHRLLLDTWRGLESGLRLSLLLDQLAPGHHGDLAASHRALLDSVKRGDMGEIRTALATHLVADARHADGLTPVSNNQH